jgi:hypothetical protein
LLRESLTIEEVWQSRIDGAPKFQSDMRTAPNNVEAFYQDMNFTKGDDQFIGVRSSLLNKAARQYLFFAAVKQNDEEAANLLLSQLIQAACMVSGLAAEHPQFRPLAELGHDGICNFFNLLDFSFIDAGDVVVPEWHSPEWKAGETAMGLFIRLKSLAASEGLVPSPKLDNILVQKFKLAVKAACRASPDDELVSRVHDDFVAGYSSYSSHNTFVLGLQQKAIAKRPRSGPGRPSKRAAEALMGGQPADQPPSGVDVGAVQQQLQALQLRCSPTKRRTLPSLHARGRTMPLPSNRPLRTLLRLLLTQLSWPLFSGRARKHSLGHSRRLLPLRRSLTPSRGRPQPLLPRLRPRRRVSTTPTFPSLRT